MGLFVSLNLRWGLAKKPDQEVECSQMPTSREMNKNRGSRPYLWRQPCSRGICRQVIRTAWDGKLSPPPHFRPSLIEEWFGGTGSGMHSGPVASLGPAY